MSLLPGEGVRSHQGGRDDLRLRDRERSPEGPLLDRLKPLQIPSELELELGAAPCAGEDRVQVLHPLLKAGDTGACAPVLVASLPGCPSLSEVVASQVLQLGSTPQRCLALG